MLYRRLPFPSIPTPNDRSQPGESWLPLGFSLLGGMGSRLGDLIGQSIEASGRRGESVAASQGQKGAVGANEG